MNDYGEYNPLDYDNLTRNCVQELLTRGSYTLPIEPFDGADVYELFYTGDLEPYALIRSRDAALPIYVGKAEPPGGRTGVARQSSRPTRALFLRLREHANSIRAAQNLKLEDILCRFLVVTPLWITMAERFSDRALPAGVEPMP